MRELTKFWLDVVFPPVCARCGRAGWILCPNCSATLPQTPAAICHRCGRIAETPDSLGPNSLCRECRAHPSPLVQMRAPLRYQEPTSTLIHRYKYEGYFALAGPLAQFLIAGWPVWEQPPDLILPIPLHPRRRRRRGYNQSERELDDNRVRESIKEIAQLDGAFIIASQGYAMSAGRILDAPAHGLTLSKGLGARHWAAAAISKATKAIAIAVSESTGTVRLFQNGVIVLRIEPMDRAMKWQDFEHEPPVSGGD